MKIFAIENNYPQNNNSESITLIDKSILGISLKADSSLLKSHKPFFIPDNLGKIDYKTEIVVRISKLGKTIPERFAQRYYDAITIGINFSAIELKQKLEKEHLPCDLSKNFDGSSVIGEWVDKDKFIDIQRIRFNLNVDSNKVQSGYTGDMIVSVDEIISYLSQFFTLKTGDIIYTGCPCREIEAQINTHFEGFIEERKVLDFNCK